MSSGAQARNHVMATRYRRKQYGEITLDSDDYHDFVFQGRRFIGEFEQMYKKSKMPPWHQDRVPQEIDVRVLKAVAATYAPYERILDVGCGLCYLANELAGLGSRVFGIDISKTAIEAARQQFPHLTLRVRDVADRTTTDPLFPDTGTFQLIVVRALLWYVVRDIATVVRNLTNWVAPGGFLLIHQNFPPLGASFYGKSIIPGPDSLRERFLNPGYLRLVLTNHLDNSVKGGGNDDWHTFLLQRSA